jgi:chromosome segregation ATPase
MRDARLRLAEMSQERNRLRQEGETLIDERTEQLRVELERQLEQERQRLASQGLATSELTSRLREREQELSRQQQEELETYKRQIEEQLAEREESLTQMISEYDQNLLELQTDKERIEEELQQLEADSEARLQRERETLERERTAVQQQLESLQAENEKERLVLDQILSGYSRVSDSLQIPDYEQALQQLDVIQSFLSQESVASLPAVQRRRAVELFIIQSLRDLIENQQSAISQPTTNLIAAAELLTSVSQTVDQADAAYRSGDHDKAKELYISAIETIPKLKQSYPVLRDLDRQSAEAEVESLQDNIVNLQEVINGLESELESQRGEAGVIAVTDPDLLERIEQLEAQVASTNQELAEERSKLQRATERLNENQELLERIRTIDKRFDLIAADAAAVRTEDQLLSLLETKLRLNEVLNSSPVRQDYPNLYDNVEAYLRVYGQTFENEGKVTMLQDVITLLQALTQGKSTEELLSIVVPYEEEELQQLLQQFFTVLYVLNE